MIGNSKVQHGVPPDAFVRLQPHKLGRHYHKVPHYISEAANKYPRVIGDYFLRNFRVHLEQKSIAVDETVNGDPDCVFRSTLGKVGFSIARTLLGEVLEGYYGGVNVPGSESSPISTSEERMRDRLGREVSELFGRAILGGTSLGKLEAYDNAYDRPSWDYRVGLTFENHVTSTTSSMHIYLDHQIADLLISKMAGPGSATSMGDPLDNIKRLPVRMECIVASMQMMLADVLALRPDDIILVRMQERCDVRIAQHRLFRGAIFESDGSLCLTSLESVKPT
ncbi:flagellar motor switch protein FliM [Halopseudomonas xinjiangensis]|uniref:Flagellar motor switch protein FliM n=1 Tax=Halopseudomonas xinjiangensis TaxID=487184 RepID=A0A1H1YQ78_9GAMM|nr:FliM/FliN family flagellar motor switch protein [Halopseudomonas xinjiangensis]SDT23276.1 flagellar motor switch protein FliM [Halopseudomonas xinjiangensis]